MAVPRLATPKPFYLLDPAALTVAFDIAATSGGAAKAAPKVGVDEMHPVDLVVCGSVAVNRQGVRVGKGAGCSDIEWRSWPRPG
jgi:5-formyltetrahydrofolate cyclo-ligase